MAYCECLIFTVESVICAYVQAYYQHQPQQDADNMSNQRYSYDGYQQHTQQPYQQQMQQQNSMLQPRYQDGKGTPFYILHLCNMCNVIGDFAFFLIANILFYAKYGLFSSSISNVIEVFT